MAEFHYGVTDAQQVKDMADAVVFYLGGGSQASNLLIETASQETHLGRYPDKYPHKHGVGLCQFDLIGFEDTRDRTSAKVKERVRQSFGVNMDSIEHRDLAFSPLLSLIWCRCFYLLRPGAIPSDIQGRGEYWKKYYNSELGAGTVEEYAENAHNAHQELMA